MSGLFLNSDEVLTHGFSSCFRSPGLAQFFFRENVFCAFPLKALRVSPTTVFLAGRKDVPFFRFAGGSSLVAWSFLLVAFACCVIPKRKDQEVH